MTMQPNKSPHFWTLDLWEPTPANLETLLEASISAARRIKNLPRDLSPRATDYATTDQSNTQSAYHGI